MDQIWPQKTLIYLSFFLFFLMEITSMGQKGDNCYVSMQEVISFVCRDQTSVNSLHLSLRSLSYDRSLTQRFNIREKGYSCSLFWNSFLLFSRCLSLVPTTQIMGRVSLLCQQTPPQTLKIVIQTFHTRHSNILRKITPVLYGRTIFHRFLQTSNH